MVIGAHRKGQWLPMYAYVFMYALCVQPFGDLTFLPGGVSVHCIFFFPEHIQRDIRCSSHLKCVLYTHKYLYQLN